MRRLLTLKSLDLSQENRTSSIFVAYPSNYTNKATPHWWPGGNQNYQAYRERYSFKSRKDIIQLGKGLFYLNFANEAAKIGPENILIKKEGPSVFTAQDPRWISVFPGLTLGNIDNASVDPRFLETFHLEATEKRSIVIPTIFSVSHFLAEALPHLILAAMGGFVGSVSVGHVSGWQRMLIELICNDANISIVYRHPQGTAPADFWYLVHAANTFYIKDLRFYEGLAITSGYLAYLADKYSISSLISMNVAYESKRRSIPSSAYGKSIYLSRYFHEISANPTRPPRVINYHELASAAIAKNWFVLCPERYTFWSIYSILASAPKIICDNGSSQIHALINQPFLNRLGNLGLGALTTLVSARFVEQANESESWMWWSSVLGNRNYFIQTGQEVSSFDYLPAFMRPCRFCPSCFVR